MFKNLFKKLAFDEARCRNPEERFFSNIVGYSDIKKLIMRSIISKEPSHVLLTGRPSSKTVFLLEMLKGLDHAYFIDAVGSSGAGMVDYLFDYPSTKYLLIDE